MKNVDSRNHVTGKSVYVDDIPVQTGTLYGTVFGSPKAHGKIISLDLSEAESLQGVVRIFTYQDIPGENQIGGIIEDEPLFAEDEVHFIGHPIAFVVAKNEKIAQKATKLIKIEIEELEAITDPRVAQKKGQLLILSTNISYGKHRKRMGSLRLHFRRESRNWRPGAFIY